MKTKLRHQAIALRKKGYLYSEIAGALGVSRSSAYVWTSNVTLSDTQQKELGNKLYTARLANVTRLGLTNKKRRAAQEETVRAEASKLVHDLNLSSDYKKLLCAVLLWCEGSKTTSGVRFINSDPTMVRTFLDLFRAAFTTEESKFRALVHLHEYHDEEAQLRYWSEITSIPLSQFHKPYVKPHTGKKIHDGYPGCISIRYQDGTLGKTLSMIYTEFGKMYRGVR